MERVKEEIKKECPEPFCVGGVVYDYENQCTIPCLVCKSEEQLDPDRAGDIEAHFVMIDEEEEDADGGSKS